MANNLSLNGGAILVIATLLFACKPKDAALLKRKAILNDSLRKWEKILPLEYDTLQKILITGTQKEQLQAKKRFDSIYQIPVKLLNEFVEVKKELNELDF